MNRKGKIILTFGTLLFVVSACYNDNKEEIYQNSGTPSECDTTDVSYSATIAKIANDNCATSGCHVGNSPQSGLDFSTYEDLKTVALDGRLLNRLKGVASIMPPSGSLPTCDIEKVTLWVNDGAPNN